MSVRWNIGTNSWTAHEEAPALVHGIAMIRATLPSICLYGFEDQLHLQLGGEHFLLTADQPQISCSKELLSGGLRRIFTLQAVGTALYTERYWALSGPDFFALLAHKSADPDWRSTSAKLWSAGIDSAQLRQSWPG